MPNLTSHLGLTTSQHSNKKATESPVAFLCHLV